MVEVKPVQSPLGFRRLAKSLNLHTDRRGAFLDTETCNCTMNQLSSLFEHRAENYDVRNSHTLDHCCHHTLEVERWMGHA